MDTSATQLENIYGCLGDDVGIAGLGVPEITDPCVFDGVNDEGVTATFSSLVHIENVPKQFVDGIREGEDNRSGIIRYDWVDDRPCGRGKHFMVLQFVGNIKGYYPPHVVIPVQGVLWDAKYYWCEAFTQTEKVILLGFVKDRDKIRPSQSDAGRHILMSHWP